jgi:DsbC/DsbD-like thiol-disulfide interchange protein
MTRTRFAALIAAFLLPWSGTAFSAASEWTTVLGGAVRVVVSSMPDENGLLRGALQVDLEPGWKTYWLDPGSAGVPPTVTVRTGGEPGEVEIGFPPPSRFDDGYAVWAGYDQPVSLALTIAPAATDESLEFSVFLGVCETICIPVQSAFSVEADRGGANAEHEAIVEAAFAALPQPERPGFSVLAARMEGEDVIVEAVAPAGASADFFMASTSERQFGTPEREIQGERVTFRVPVLSASTNEAEQASYTLISGDEAVTGSVMVGE